MDKEISKTFCSLPWTHMATYTDGSALLCCVAKNDSRLNLNTTSFKEAWNSPYFRNVRRKMLRGEQVNACNRCYVEEKNGYKSHRLMENEVWERRLGAEGLADLASKTEPDGYLDNGLMSLDLRLGNLCNLQCVMCRPHDSSKWMSLAKMLNQHVTQGDHLKGDLSYKLSADNSLFSWHQGPHVWENLREFLPHMKEIIIGGGEPLIVDEHQRLMDECIQSGYAKNILLRYHTNGTKLPDQVLEEWAHFKEVELFLSLDAVGDRCNYVRYPSKWNDLKSNIFKLENITSANIRVMLLCSVHALNLFYMDEYGRWVEEQNFKRIMKDFNGYYHPGIVHFPQYLSPQVYPKPLKAVVTERIMKFEEVSRKPSHKIQGVVNYMNESDQSHLLPELREYVLALDKVRGTHFGRSFPELNEYLNFY